MYEVLIIRVYICIFFLKQKKIITATGQTNKGARIKNIYIYMDARTFFPGSTRIFIRARL